MREIRRFLAQRCRALEERKKRRRRLTVLLLELHKKRAQLQKRDFVSVSRKAYKDLQLLALGTRCFRRALWLPLFYCVACVREGLDVPPINGSRSFRGPLTKRARAWTKRHPLETKRIYETLDRVLFANAHVLELAECLHAALMPKVSSIRIRI